MEKWFSEGLKLWYHNNKRDLPWRRVQDPYKIWLSEIILQQTQVNQGLSYYYKFVERFPTVTHLANASEDQVLKLWQGLGYYSRARNLHSAAKVIFTEHQGKFPEDYAGIKSLKGVGDYTAAAIASFAYNHPYATVDGNVYRVLSRVFGISTPIDSTKGKKDFQELATMVLDLKDPATHNQAIMEFGSQFCRPVNPDCPSCTFRAKCSAFKNDQVQILPVKTKKVSVRKRYFNYVVLSDKKGNVYLNKRGPKDIWEGMYEFPLIETNKQIGTKQLLASEGFSELCSSPFDLLHTSKPYKHVLTHQVLHTRFFVVSVKVPASTTMYKSNLSELGTYAFPRLIDKFLQDCDLKEIL